MNKKLIALGLLGISSIGLLTGCGVKNTPKEETGIVTEKPSEAKKEKPSVTVDQIELVDFQMKEEYGSQYMEAKFKNNSDKNIVGITFIYDIGGEKSYLATYDTLLPGDISVVEETNAPASGNPDDVKLLSVEIDVKNDDQTVTYIEYDAKLDTYEVYTN